MTLKSSNSKTDRPKRRFMTLEKWKRLGPEAGNQEGLWALVMDCWERGPGGMFIHVGRLVVNSGGPDRQHFRTLADQVEGEREPIPEGVYADMLPLEFASGRWGDYSARFPSIDSPISLKIYVRRAIEFHLDGNRRWAPGSAGCVVFRSVADMETFVSWFENDPHMMTSLWVNWRLGTVHYPPGLAIPPLPKAA